MLTLAPVLFLQRNAESMVPPPAPQLKAQISPLANLFHQETQPPVISHSDHCSGTWVLVVVKETRISHNM